MRAKWWFVLLLVVALIAAAIVPLPPHARVARHHLWRALTFPFPDDARGTIQAQGKSLGDFGMNVDECESGDWDDSRGFRFFDGSQPGYAGHIASPVDGEATLSLNSPTHHDAVEFFQSDCSVWDVEVKRTWSVFRDNRRSRIHPFAGHARFTCYHPDTGARISGDLYFRYCQ